MPSEIIDGPRNSTTLNAARERGCTPHRRRFPRALAVGAAGAAALLAATACSSGTPEANQVTNASTNVQFTACTSKTCAGVLDGHPFQIVMPKKWNGTLLLYSQDTPEIRLTANYRPAAEVAPGWADKKRAVADALLAQGYALAGAATPAGGWQVDAQVAVASKLREHFESNIAKPNRIYTWGQGAGAVSSVVLAQRDKWVNGAAPLCGLLAGLNPNYDLALDSAFLVKTLLAPSLKLTGYKSQAEALANYKVAMKAVGKAAKDKYGEGGIKLRIIAVAGAVPTKTATNAGTGFGGKAITIPENLTPILARSTVGRYAIEQQFGGNPSNNFGTNYAARVTDADRKSLEILGKGAMDKYLKVIKSAPRVGADSTARDAASRSGEITGQVRVPTTTLHTQYDPQAIVQNESMYKAAAIKAGQDQNRLLQVNVTSPPTTYPEKGAVAYGAGHCNFTTQSIVGTVAIVNDLVRDGIYPTAANSARLMGQDSGYNPAFPLYLWPAGINKV